jgi:hypothetical protein
MGYRRWDPSLALAPHVESFWIQESPPAGADVVPTRVVPTGRIGLVVEYGDPFLQVGPEGERPCPALALSGQMTGPRSFRASGRTGLLLVNFHPWATGFFGPSEELVERMVDLSDVVGAAAGAS